MAHPARSTAVLTTAIFVTFLRMNSSCIAAGDPVRHLENPPFYSIFEHVMAPTS
jgi:hypothetical protein